MFNICTVPKERWIPLQYSFLVSNHLQVLSFSLHSKFYSYNLACFPGLFLKHLGAGGGWGGNQLLNALDYLDTWASKQSETI